MTIKSKRERLQLLINDLQAAPAQSSEADVLALIENVLDRIEDAHSGVTKNPNHFTSTQTDGRMYAPHPSFKVRSAIAGCSCYRQAAHKTYIASNGAFRIVALAPGGSEVVVVEKSGADGKGVP